MHHKAAKAIIRLLQKLGFRDSIPLAARTFVSVPLRQNKRKK